MLRFTVSTFIVFLILLLYSGCTCLKVDCKENGGFVTLRLLRNGNNVFYGPDALSEKDSVKHFVISDFKLENSVYFLDTFQSVYFFIPEGFPSIIEINGISSDTFRITTEVLDMDECCTGYRVTSVLMNGIVICIGECEEVIDVEI